MTEQVAILSTTKLPRFLGDDHPDEASLFAEDTRLVEAPARQGVAARRVAWRMPTEDWQNFTLALVRTP